MSVLKLLSTALVSLALLALAGCSTVPKTPDSVLIPVAASCPVPDIPGRPLAPAALHDKSASDADKARALAIFFNDLNGWADALEATLRGYAKPTK